MSNYSAPWLPNQPAKTQADRRVLRLAQNGSPAAQASSSGNFQSWMGLHFRGHCLQPRTYAETAGFGSSIRLTQGSSVSGGPVETLRTTQTTIKNRRRTLQISQNPPNEGSRNNTSLRTLYFSEHC